MEPCSLRDGSHQPQGLSRGIGKNYHLLDTGEKPAKSFMEKRDIGNMIQIGMLQVIPHADMYSGTSWSYRSRQPAEQETRLLVKPGKIPFALKISAQCPSPYCFRYISI